MRTIDTNVVVRFLVEDDADQQRVAAELIESGDVFVPLTVLLETEWVLRDLYEYDKVDVLRQLQAFAGLPTVHLEEANRADRAFAWAQAGMEFADALHLASAAGSFATFDRKLAKRARRFGVAVEELRARRAPG